MEKLFNRRKPVPSSNEPYVEQLAKTTTDDERLKLLSNIRFDVMTRFYQETKPTEPNRERNENNNKLESAYRGFTSVRNEPVMIALHRKLDEEFRAIDKVLAAMFQREGITLADIDIPLRCRHRSAAYKCNLFWLPVLTTSDLLDVEPTIPFNFGTRMVRSLGDIGSVTCASSSCDIHRLEKKMNLIQARIGDLVTGKSTSDVNLELFSLNEKLCASNMKLMKLLQGHNEQQRNNFRRFTLTGPCTSEAGESKRNEPQRKVVRPFLRKTTVTRTWWQRNVISFGPISNGVHGNTYKTIEERKTLAYRLAGRRIPDSLVDMILNRFY